MWPSPPRLKGSPTILNRGSCFDKPCYTCVCSESAEGQHGAHMEVVAVVLSNEQHGTECLRGLGLHLRWRVQRGEAGKGRHVRIAQHAHVELARQANCRHKATETQPHYLLRRQPAAVTLDFVLHPLQTEGAPVVIRSRSMYVHAWLLLCELHCHGSKFSIACLL